MTSIWSRAGFAMAMLGMAQVGASAAPSAVPVPAAALTSSVQAVGAPTVVTARTPAYLRQRVDALGKAFPGTVGIAVQSVDHGWMTGWRYNELFPQQSVSKLWVAITALDAVDKKRVSLDQRVTLNRSDLTLFHQPIRSLVLKGGHTTSLRELMVKAITTSDNTANDKLMRSVGGPSAVRELIATKRLGAIRFYDGERALQSKIAGLLWSQSYSVGNAFYQARNALPKAVRRAAFNSYVNDPYDGASPEAIVGALAKLKRGELLSPASTARLLSIMGNTKTGPNRLKGGLKAGWTLSHKTGTGQVLDGKQAGYNDIGILTAPDGRSYAVAVMIKLTGAPLGTRMKLMNEVVRETIRQHEMSGGADYTL